MGISEAKEVNLIWPRKMIPYDARVRIVNAYTRRGNAREVADVFGVSTREVYRLAARERAAAICTPVRKTEAENRS